MISLTLDIPAEAIQMNVSSNIASEAGPSPSLITQNSEYQEGGA